MPGRIETFKPSASRKTHLLLAALMWSVVGSGLLVAGTRWLWRGEFSTALRFVALVAAVMLGWSKAHFVLRRAAGKIARRIETHGDDRCLGGFLSLKTWGLVAVMTVGGRLLRALPIPIAIIGFLYALVGTALLVASRYLWRARRILVDVST